MNLIFLPLPPGRSGRQRRSPAATAPGCGSRPRRAAGVPPTLCSSCEPARMRRSSVRRDQSSLDASCSPAGQHSTPPTQITGRVTQGDKQHPATFICVCFFFHLILCTVYPNAKRNTSYCVWLQIVLPPYVCISSPKHSDMYMPLYLWIFAIYLHQSKCIC